jgi:tetratricopeptide (TPR) repeat protein
MKEKKATDEQEEFQLQLAHDCFNLGIDYWFNSEYDMALHEFRRSLEIREDTRGKLDEDTAKSYLWVGSLCWHKEDYENALDCFSRAFRIRMELFGSKEECGIITSWINKMLDGQDNTNKEAYWNNLLNCIARENRGDKLRAEGKFDKAINEYRSALMLEYGRRGLTVNTPNRPLADAGDLYSKIARAYVAKEDYARAMMEYRQALSIYLAVFGRHHRFTVKTYQNIAGVANRMGFADGFVNEYLTTLYNSILREKTADSLLTQKDYAGALTVYEEVLKLEGTGMGMFQVQTAMVYSKLAKVHAKLGNKDDALLHYSKALGIFDAMLGSQHRHTINAMTMVRNTILSL